MIPEYLQVFVNEMSLQYSSIDSFLQLPSTRARNIFHLVATMERNPQTDPALMLQFAAITPMLAHVIQKIPAHCVTLFQKFLVQLHQQYLSTMRNDRWFEKTEALPPTSRYKYVLTGRDRIRQMRKYVQSESAANMESQGASDCKKIPTPTQHHSNTFLGLCGHGVALIAVPMSHSESPRFLFSTLLEYWEKAPRVLM